jgi:hypothetical protein
MANTNTAKNRPTAAEKRAALKKQDAAEARAFESSRQMAWTHVWVKALELFILMQDSAIMEGLMETHSWYFGNFTVNVQEHYFTMEITGSEKITRESLTHRTFENINHSLDDGFTFRKNHLEFLEKEHQKALERASKVQAAKAKLSDEELNLLREEFGED